MDWRSHWKAGVAALVAVVGLWIAFVNGNRIPLLGSLDLGIHGFGHLITSPFGTILSFFMGSGLQVLVPFGLARYFWFWQRDHLSTGLLVVWGATSMQDVSVYVADAPYQDLQLIGGTHDWWYLLSHFERMAWANELSRGIWVLGLGMGLAGLGMILTPMAKAVWKWLGVGPVIRVKARGPASVREPRAPSEEN